MTANITEENGSRLHQEFVPDPALSVSYSLSYLTYSNSEVDDAIMLSLEIRKWSLGKVR